jgi:AcrR family transcriptional regulator
MNYHHGNLRRELLDRAAQVITEQGVEDLSLRALAQQLGVSHAAPARHFKDKADLLRALAKEGFQKITEYILAAADAAGPDPLARYVALGHAFVRFSRQFPAYYKISIHPEVMAQADDELKELHRVRSVILFDTARQAQAAGWLEGEDLEAAVAFSFAAVRGLAAVLSDKLFMRSLGEVDRDALIDRAMRLIVDPSNPQTARNVPKNASRNTSKAALKKVSGKVPKIAPRIPLKKRIQQRRSKSA